jgi:creatinine amidohydrolase/Fe(II)-dependent formamide hydrolase-like protein
MTTSDRSFLLAEMTSVEVGAEIAAGRSTIVVPFGAVEQHGPHLPLDTDAVLGDRLGLLIAKRLNALCAPTIRIGCSQHHLSFAGTLSFKPETLHVIVHDLVDSLATHGFRRIVLLPTHGGNEGPLTSAAAASKREGLMIFVPLCHQHRCSLLSGNTSRTALQNPSAPSPTASTGAAVPRRLVSRSRKLSPSVDRGQVTQRHADQVDGDDRMGSGLRDGPVLAAVQTDRPDTRSHDGAYQSIPH